MYIIYRQLNELNLIKDHTFDVNSVLCEDHPGCNDKCKYISSLLMLHAMILCIYIVYRSRRIEIGNISHSHQYPNELPYIYYNDIENSTW